MHMDDYPAIRANPDKDVKLEDGKFMVLATSSLRQAKMLLHMWKLARAITEEQCAVMFMMLNERAAQEEAE